MQYSLRHLAAIRQKRRLMDYVGYRRRGLPIGSGVTQAACKTVFTQRFKRSGMRWNHVIYLSGIWEELPTPSRAAWR